MNWEKLIVFLCTLLLAIKVKCDLNGMELLVNFTGEYWSTINLGRLNVNDNLTIKLLVPGIINKRGALSLNQGTY